MKVSEFVNISQKNQWFCIKNVGESLDSEEDVMDKFDVEFGDYWDCEIKELDFILDIQRSCSYTLDVIAVLFIEKPVIVEG